MAEPRAGRRERAWTAADGLVDASTATPTLGDVVDCVEDHLARCGFENPRGEAREIVAALLDVPRHLAACKRAEPLDALFLARAVVAAQRRAQGMPFQYAVGRASFRHLTLDLDDRVLIPRPETELLVEFVLEACRGTPGGSAIDVGTGSGAVAIALAQEGAFDRVIGIDVSLDALAVAEYNATALAPSLRATVEFRHGSLLGPVGDVLARAVVSNPPYIALEEASSLPASVRDWEPAVALFSAGNGMRVTAGVVRQAAERLEGGGLLALEVDARRAALVAEMVSADGRYADVSVRLDLAGRDRFVVARRRGGELR